MSAPTPVALSVFEDAGALAPALAEHVSEALRARIARDGAASLAVSGGRTPERFLAALSAMPLAWDRVTVTLVDERWVPEDSPRSNAALVRHHLLQNSAAAARFVPLYTGAPTPEDGLADATRRLAGLPLPFAAVVLGMGDDGHTASFFPGAPTLASAIDPDGKDLLAAIRAEAAGEPRMTFTLPSLIGADMIVLHIEGMGKRSVLDKARREGPEGGLPIRAVLRHVPRPLDVVWCP